MAGTNPIATYLPVNFTTQDPATYKSRIDGNGVVSQRIIDLFAPHELNNPNMRVSVDPGNIFSGVTLTEIGAFSSSVMTSGLNTITVADTTGIAINNLVTGEGLPTGNNTTVSNIAGTTITLSQNATASITTVLKFSQRSALISAPVTNPRIDRIVANSTTGAISVVTGTEAVSPVPPAITGGTVPVARILLQISTTEITNSMITDERNIGSTAGLQIIKQIVTSTTSTVVSGSTIMPDDNTIPQITEGFQVLTGTITPSNASNKLLIEFDGFAQRPDAAVIVTALFQDAIANALSANMQYTEAVGATGVNKLTLMHVRTAGTTSLITFRIRIGLPVAGTINFLANTAGGAVFGGVNIATLKITEYV